MPVVLAPDPILIGSGAAVKTKKNVLNIGCHKKRGEPEVRDLASALARQPLCISFSLCFLDRIEHTIRNPELVAATPDAKEKPDSV
jgi:hypothetical protein